MISRIAENNPTLQHRLHKLGQIQTGARLSLVNFLAVQCLCNTEESDQRTVFSFPWGPHLAGVASKGVVAGGSVLAGVGRAFIHLLLAVAARVAHLAMAVVGVARVQT